MSRSPTGHGFWMPASIAGNAWPAVLATNPCDARTSGLPVPRRTGVCPAGQLGTIRLRSALTKQLAVMWLIDAA